MRFFLLFISCLFNYHASAQTWVNSALPLHRAQKALTDVIVHDIFSPPVAGRIYAYSNIAVYEVLLKQNQQYHSLYKQVDSFPQIPVATTKICNSLAGVYAFLLTGKSLVFSEAILQDSINNILQWYKNNK
ncbi:MAG TPA: hypothetical protein VF610_13630, partial [Segetibacter sp.]